jgi:hypothetical protein
MLGVSATRPGVCCPPGLVTSKHALGGVRMPAALRTRAGNRHLAQRPQVMRPRAVAEAEKSTSNLKNNTVTVDNTQSETETLVALKGETRPGESPPPPFFLSPPFTHQPTQTLTHTSIQTFTTTLQACSPLWPPLSLISVWMSSAPRLALALAASTTSSGCSLPPAPRSPTPTSTPCAPPSSSP